MGFGLGPQQRDRQAGHKPVGRYQNGLVGLCLQLCQRRHGVQMRAWGLSRVAPKAVFQWVAVNDRDAIGMWVHRPRLKRLRGRWRLEGHDGRLVVSADAQKPGLHAAVGAGAQWQVNPVACVGNLRSRHLQQHRPWA